MKKKLTTRQSATRHSHQAVKAGRDGSPDRPATAVHTVTPISERIIKETSVKRGKAMKVLANR